MTWDQDQVDSFIKIFNWTNFEKKFCRLNTSTTPPHKYGKKRRKSPGIVPPNITKFYITWFRDAQNHSFHVKFTWFHVNSFRDHVKFVIFVHFTWNSRDVISRDEALPLTLRILFKVLRWLKLVLYGHGCLLNFLWKNNKENLFSKEPAFLNEIKW